MSQLILKTDSFSQYQGEDNAYPEVLSFAFEQEVDWDEAELLLSIWLRQQAFEVQEFILGADRLCWRLTFAGYACLFNAELLTQSFWFEFEDKITLEAFKMAF
ncbi:DUF3630 family protein [Catenovulum sp. SM1970]|uniref:DUF3630 family protein n=1 Tax=Marinifaba aquimaris TaxID=2741323 RepID=UPI0015719DAA|nr:DUF3630 family protein [Marinifaba aquimaris]NTS77217.1 DUF3630 family protein [Marinifaba aquimaris]